MAEWDILFKKKKYRWKKPSRFLIDLVPLLKKRKFKRVLDLGCGAGRHVVYLTKKGFFVVGSDISSRALKLSQKWLEKEKVKNYCLVEHDMTELPFPDKHFDAVISVNVIHHNPLDKVDKTVAEIRRVLKKRGLVVLTVSSTNDYKFGLGKKLGKNTYLAHSARGVVIDAGVIHHFFDKKGVKKLLSKFKILDLKEIVEEFTVRRKRIKSVHWYVLAENR